jgi:hypothetical protein
MRWFLLSLGLAGLLGAQVPLHIVAVERRGPPPYEIADRIYGVAGDHDPGLRVGDRLLVKRADAAVILGHLRVIESRPGRANALFEPLEGSYPMKGDLVLRSELRRLPVASSLDPAPLVSLPKPKASTEPPPREGLLFFLPGRSDLSIGGVRKLETWVESWGAEGRWAVQVPATKGIKPELQKLRAESLQAALRALGIEPVAVETGLRTAEGLNHPTWVRHWD